MAYESMLLESRVFGNFDYLAVSIHLPPEAGNKTDREKDGEGVSEEVSRIPAIPTLWSDPEAVDSRNGQGDGTEQ
jgi:hypothetical protein